MKIITQLISPPMIDTVKLLYRLNKIGIALSVLSDVNSFFEYILKEAREFTNCDAGTLYTVYHDQLELTVSQNQTLSERAGDNVVKTSYINEMMPISNQSIAGYVTLTGKTVNIENAYQIPSRFPFKHNKSFDLKANYKTISILTVPMKDPSERILGVLQLINHKEQNGDIVTFPEKLVELTQSLASQAAVAYRNVTYQNELKQAHYDTIFRLSVAAEFKDTDTANHIKRMSNYCFLIAENLGLPVEEQELILHAAPMHDIGKIGIPDSILLKPAKLNKTEWEEMKKHTIYGAKILENARDKITETSRLIALHHHERWDGKGYPFGLHKEEIPIYARICTIADVFDALTSKRPYKQSFPLEKSLKIIKMESGTIFDPEFVEAFLAYPDKISQIKEKYVADQHSSD